MKINFLHIDNHKLLKEFSIDFEKDISILIGINGSGKSTILESIFNKYIEEDDKKVICFTSGQNELFYSIFNKHKQQSNKFKPDELFLSADFLANSNAFFSFFSTPIPYK